MVRHDMFFTKIDAHLVVFCDLDFITHIADTLTSQIENRSLELENHLCFSTHSVTAALVPSGSGSLGPSLGPRLGPSVPAVGVRPRLLEKLVRSPSRSCSRRGRGRSGGGGGSLGPGARDALKACSGGRPFAAEWRGRRAAGTGGLFRGGDLFTGG